MRNPFEIYRNEEFVLFYTNEGHLKGVTHLLQVQNLSTGKTTGMWIDPTGIETNSRFLQKVQHLEQLKSVGNETSYNQAVAVFIEALIATAGYSSLEIASWTRTALKFHPDPTQLDNTVRNMDLSYIRHEDRDRFANIEEMRQAVAGFVETLKSFIVGLLGILITAEDAQASVSIVPSVRNFSIFQETDDTTRSATVTVESVTNLTA